MADSDNSGIKVAIDNTLAEIWGDGLGYVISLSADEINTAKNLVDYLTSTIQQASTAKPHEYGEFADAIREITQRLLGTLQKYGLANRKSCIRFVNSVNQVLEILEKNS